MTKETIKVVSKPVGTVIVTYDGTNYSAQLRSSMKGAGFVHWSSQNTKDIAYAKALCYAEHLAKYGNIGQVAPEKSEEYHDLKSVDTAASIQAMYIQEAIDNFDIQF